LPLPGLIPHNDRVPANSYLYPPGSLGIFPAKDGRLSYAFG